MDPKAVIESYVDEVVRRLPAADRNDVGFELRDLLAEELANKADEAGRPADEAMTLALLRDFGAPSEVAERYRPTGFEIVRKSEARAFALIALVGVLVQWTLSFPIQVLLPTDGEFLIRMRDWWVTSAIHAFAWPGIMVTCAIIASWSGLRPSEAHERVAKMIAAQNKQPAPVRREVLDPDRVNRWAVGIGLVGLAIAAPFVLFAQSFMQHLPEPARQAFTLDDGFAHGRLPFLLLPWLGQFIVFAMVLANGRWRRTTRVLDQVFNIAGGVVIAWFIFAGPMFQNAQVDAFAKLVTGAVTAIVALVSISKLYREQMRVGSSPSV